VVKPNISAHYKISFIYIFVSFTIVFAGALTSLDAGKSLALNNGGSTLTTSPISIDLTGKPGSAISTKLHVVNGGPIALPVNVYLFEFKAKGINGQADIYKPASDDDTTKWVSFSQTSFIAQPQIWQTVNMTINLPKTAALGYYYAVLFAPKPPLPQLTQNTNTLKSANAIFVLVNALSPNASPDLNISSFSSQKTIYQYLPATFNVNIHNGGNIFLIPSGDLFISRTANGPSLATININPGQGNVLPGTNRVFQVNWNDGFPVNQVKKIDGQAETDKQGNPITSLNWNFSKLTSFRFGKYYARVVMTYNNGIRDVPATAIVSFWVIPWFLLICILIFVLLVVVGIFSIFRLVFKGVKKPKRRYIR
jgi:hypothetical protein